MIDRKEEVPLDYSYFVRHFGSNLQAIYKMVGNKENPGGEPEKPPVDDGQAGGQEKGGDDLAGSRTRVIFDKMDTNKDNVLSKEEFVQGCMQDEALFKMLASTTSAM